MPDMKIVMVPIGDLKPAQYNPRKLSKKREAELETSLREFGFVDPLVVNGRKDRMNIVIGGHQRLRLAGKLGMVRVPVVYVDLDAKREKELNLRLNKNTGEFDWDLLKKFDVDLLKMVGFDAADILKNIGLDAEAGEGKDADPGDRPKKPKARRGVVYRLGDHMVMCGDATDRADMEKLMGRGVTSRATMAFTDPPWNVAIGEGQAPSSARKGIKGDNMPPEQFEAFLAASGAIVQAFVSGDVYVVLGSSEWPRLDGVLRGAGFHWSATIIWAKDVFVLGRSKYQRRYEPIWYGWHSAGKSSFRGPRNQDDVWEIPRPKVSKEHPTMKPLELCRRAIINSSKKGDIVLDMFGGAGSTLMACEDTGRICRMMEKEMQREKRKRMRGKKDHQAVLPKVQVQAEPFHRVEQPEADDPRLLRLREDADKRRTLNLWA